MAAGLTAASQAARFCSALADQIGNHPILLPLLDGSNVSASTSRGEARSQSASRPSRGRATHGAQLAEEPRSGLRGTRPALLGAGLGLRGIKARLQQECHGRSCAQRCVGVV
jgi:hypothetical protein